MKRHFAQIMTLVMLPSIGHAQSLNFIEFEIYGTSEATVSIEVNRRSPLTTKLIDAFSKSPKMRKAGGINPPELLVGERISINYSRQHAVGLALQVALNPAAHLRIVGNSLEFEGLQADSLYEAMNSSSSTHITRKDNLIAITELETFGGSDVTCFRPTPQQKKVRCTLLLKER